MNNPKLSSVVDCLFSGALLAGIKHGIDKAEGMVNKVVITADDCDSKEADGEELFRNVELTQVTAIIIFVRFVVLAAQKMRRIKQSE